MSMVLFYERINWEDFPSVNTAINAIRLNKMDYAVKTMDERTVALDTAKAEKSVVLNTIKDWSLDEKTGIITITKVNGDVLKFDLNIEKIPVKFELSEDGILTMTTDDGSKFTADIGSMIPVIEFRGSDTITVAKYINNGIDKTYSFTVKDGSITEKKLQPNYLADIKVQAESAELSATASAESAKEAKSYAIGETGTRDGEDTDNAKYYAEKAKEAAENASAIASVEIMTTKKAGIGKPDGETITADEDGTIRVPKISDVSLNRQTLGYTKKNLLKLDSRSGSYNGITHSSDVEKGTITFNGTFNGSAFFTYNSKFYLKAGTYILSGCPAGGNDGQTKYYRQTVRKVYSDGSGSDNNDYGNGTKITVTQEDVDDGVYFNLIIGIFAEFPQNLTFRPMIRSADIIDDTFEPYVDDVYTRLKALTPVNNLITTVPGSPLDAVMGKELSDRIAALEMAIQEITQ